MKHSLFSPLSLLITALVLPQAVLAQAAEDRNDVDWNTVKSLALEFVANESPDSVWPFELLSPEQVAGSEKKVFAHFFSPFPISMDNNPTDVDTYNKVHLSPEGSDRSLNGRGGYKAGGGGALRQRPLPAGPWASRDWRWINLAIEILRAEKLGLDGFTYDMLGVSKGNGHRRTLEMLLETAEQVAPGFKIALMPDMNAQLRRSPEMLKDAILDLNHFDSLYRLEDGRLIIAPYNGAAQSPEYWKKLMADLQAEGITSAFFPLFSGYEHLKANGEKYGDFSYGFSDWGFRDIKFAEEYDYKNSAQHAAPYTDIWMMSVAPQDVRSKSLIAWESENTRAFRYLWDAAIEGGSEYVQLVTWNDYSEASEVAPSSGTQFAYYDLTAYYTAWYKTGTPPKITGDAIYYTHRAQIFPFPEGVVAAKQRYPFRQTGKTPFVNNVEMVALLTAPAELEIEQNGKVYRTTAEAGLATLSIPVETGTPIFRIRRDQQVVVEAKSDWEVKQGGVVENPVYHGGSSTRKFTPTPGYGIYE